MYIIKSRWLSALSEKPKMLSRISICVLPCPYTIDKNAKGHYHNWIDIWIRGLQFFKSIHWDTVALGLYRNIPNIPNVWAILNPFWNKTGREEGRVKEGGWEGGDMNESINQWMNQWIHFQGVRRGNTFTVTLSTFQKVSKVHLSMLELFLFHAGHSSLLFPEYGICTWITKIMDIPVKALLQGQSKVFHKAMWKG